MDGAMTIEERWEQLGEQDRLNAHMQVFTLYEWPKAFASFKPKRWLFMPGWESYAILMKTFRFMAKPAKAPGEV